MPRTASSAVPFPRMPSLPKLPKRPKRPPAALFLAPLSWSRTPSTFVFHTLARCPRCPLRPLTPAALLPSPLPSTSPPPASHSAYRASSAGVVGQLNLVFIWSPHPPTISVPHLCSPAAAWPALIFVSLSTLSLVSLCRLRPSLGP